MITPETMQYKMVFCDIDGTLIDSAHRISGVIEGLKQLNFAENRNNICLQSASVWGV
ncbi:MAG: hypothetical protein H7X86_05640 [Gorillibacterium sp.]|nr:hypothetical protein [Gorillibacterium sp.]